MNIKTQGSGWLFLVLSISASIPTLSYADQLDASSLSDGTGGDVGYYLQLLPASSTGVVTSWTFKTDNPDFWSGVQYHSFRGFDGYISLTQCDSLDTALAIAVEYIGCANRVRNPVGPGTGGTIASSSNAVTVTFPSPISLDPLKRYIFAYYGADNTPATPSHFYGTTNSFGQGWAPFMTDGLTESYWNATYATSTATTTPICTQNCYSNVLFLPGIEGSRLYDGNNHKLWEPYGNSDALQLVMLADGTSNRHDIYTRDAIDNAYVPAKGNVYQSFMADMKTWESVYHIVATTTPYDWRVDMNTLLNNGRAYANGSISYLVPPEPGHDPYILETLRKLAATSKTGKVTIIAHSMGGLITKALLQRIGDTETSRLVDKIIFVDSPQVGTPQALGALLHGDDQGLPLNIFPTYLSHSAARQVANNMPSVYLLLPSNNYFTQVDDPVATFDPSSLPDWVSRYGNSIHSKERQHVFLIDSYQRVASSSSDTKTPVQLSDLLLTQAENTHAALDSWLPPPGVQVIQIAGWGIPTTIKGVDYSFMDNPFCKNQSLCTEAKILTASASTTIDGDGTVVVPSALWIAGSSVQNYWLDLGAYSNFYWTSTLGGANGYAPFKHGNVFEVNNLRTFLSDTITNSTKPIATYTYLSTSAPPSTTHRLRYELHSPLTLDLYDSFGHHAGISTTTHEVEEQIPGTYYMEFGDVKYLFTDASTTSHIVMKGYATSTFTFNINELQGDILLETTTFKDIPVTPHTTVTIDTQSDITTISPMHIDLTGDGSHVYNLTPKQNSTVSLDTTPPELVFSFSTTTQSLVITATDDSGYATTTSTTIYPTLKKNQSQYSGIATTTITAVDQTRNTTILTYMQQLPQKDRRITIMPLSISYNGAATLSMNTTLKYKWQFSNATSTTSYKMLASYVTNNSTSTESHWRPKKNETIVMTRPTDLDDDDSDDGQDIKPVRIKLSGLVIPSLQTKQGNIIISY